MENKYKRNLGGVIGLLFLSFITITLNLQVGFTVFENIEQQNSLLIFIICTCIVIFTIIITFLILRYELRKITEIEPDINNKEVE